MCVRSSVDGHAVPAVATPAARRTRSGSAAGRPASRLPRWCASTGWTVIRGSPSAAPPTSACRASTSGLVAAPVDGQRAPGRGRLRRLEIGEDVAAAEGVDGLLGVADQHQRGFAGEGAVEHLPLHRVGVLELVDEHDPPALAHPLAGRRVVALEGVGEPGRAGRRRTGCRGGACVARSPRGPSRRTRSAPAQGSRGRRPGAPVLPAGRRSRREPAGERPARLNGGSSARWP